MENFFCSFKFSCRSLFIWRPKEDNDSTQLQPEQKSKELIFGKAEKKSKRKFDDDSGDDCDFYSKGKNSKGKKPDGKSKTSLKVVKG